MINYSQKILNHSNIIFYILKKNSADDGYCSSSENPEDNDINKDILSRIVEYSPKKRFMRVFYLNLNIF